MSPVAEGPQPARAQWQPPSPHRRRRGSHASSATLRRTPAATATLSEGKRRPRAGGPPFRSSYGIRSRTVTATPAPVGSGGGAGATYGSARGSLMAVGTLLAAKTATSGARVSLIHLLCSHTMLTYYDLYSLHSSMRQRCEDEPPRLGQPQPHARIHTGSNLV